MNSSRELPEDGGVFLDIEDAIATITFGHPKSNALPSNVLAELASTITRAGNSDEVAVVVLQSWGDRAFCAGASFDELVAINDFSTGVEFFMGFARVINAARKCPKLLIGRVQGKAVGGGVGMAASVDYCFATQHAQVKLSELAVGIGPFVVGPAVARKVGVSAMSELAIQATEWRSAEWAHQKGLFNEVFSNTDEMDAAILALAQRLKASNPQAMAELKQIFWEGTDHWDQLLASRAEKSGKLVLSDFTRNAITQFKSKS